MSVGVNSEGSGGAANVLPLFIQTNLSSDPFEELILEGMMKADLEEPKSLATSMPKCVQENSFPDQSMYLLDQQLSTLKDKVERIKFYLSDLDDLLPR